MNKKCEEVHADEAAIYIRGSERWCALFGVLCLPVRSAARAVPLALRLGSESHTLEVEPLYGTLHGMETHKSAHIHYSTCYNDVYIQSYFIDIININTKVR